MSLHNVAFTIRNNTKETMTFDPEGSSGTHDWPSQIAPGASAEVTQGGVFSINLTAVYVMGSSGTNTYLHYYLVGIAPHIHTEHPY